MLPLVHDRGSNGSTVWRPINFGAQIPHERGSDQSQFDLSLLIHETEIGVLFHRCSSRVKWLEPEKSVTVGIVSHFTSYCKRHMPRNSWHFTRTPRNFV